MCLWTEKKTGDPSSLYNAIYKAAKFTPNVVYGGHGISL